MANYIGKLNINARGLLSTAQEPTPDSLSLAEKGSGGRGGTTAHGGAAAILCVGGRWRSLVEMAMISTGESDVLCRVYGRGDGGGIRKGMIWRPP